MSDILTRADELKAYCTECRRHFHENPELSFKEYETTAFIRRELAQMGVEMLPLDIETGVVAVIRGTKPGEGHVTALRADIDALAMPDLSGKPYASKREGVAHACGHDGHAAILLGVAKLLTELRDRFSGIVKLVFQPAEEGLGGSLIIVNSGAMKDPDVEEIVCLHSWPYFKVGEIGAWPGQYMASADKFEIRIVGKSGHGARPYKAVNPIPATALAISALQNIVSNEIVTAQQAVVTVCTIHAGVAFNVIPDAVEIGGTVRCLDAGVRDELEARIRRTVEGAAAALGCHAEVDYIRGVPSLTNDPEVVQRIIQAGRDVLGAEHIRELDGPVLGSEDFSHLVNHVGRGAFFRLGVGVPGDDSEPVTLHNSAFDFNDDAIPTGIATMVQYILNRHQ